MAFQIIDDILDLTATEAELGKPVGHDLVDGVYTLPVLRTLAGPDGHELAALLQGGTAHGGISDADVVRARAIIAGAGGFASARATVAEWLDRADDALGAFDGRPGAATLRALTTRLGAMAD